MKVRKSVGSALAAMLILAAAPLAWAQGDGDDDDRGGAQNPIEADLDDPIRGAAISPAQQPLEEGLRVRSNRSDDLGWTVELGGFLRGRYTNIQADPQVELFGRNDGFVLSDARLVTHGYLHNGLGFVLSLDAGARVIRTTPDSPVERLAARMTDTYVYYAPYHFFELNVGQFKAPFDIEEQISASRLLFVNRSLANRGVQGVEGFNVLGLSQGRQIGVRLRGSLYPLASDHETPEGPGFSYALAVANGNGPNVSMNNNDRLAYYGRASLHWADMVALGGGFFHNDTTFGELPDRVDRLFWGWTADLTVNAFGATLLANVISQEQSTPGLPQDPEITSLGYQVQVAYEEPFWGLQPAYRFAYYNPEVRPDVDENDEDATVPFGLARTHHTIGLNYNARAYPVRVMANYTIALEDPAIRLDNNRFDLLLQLEW